MTLDKHIFYTYIDRLIRARKKEKKMSKDLNRNAYISECEKDFREVQKDNKLLIHYILDRKRRRVGVILAAKPEGSDHPLMGWSLCNIKRDTFNKYVGICKALDRLQHGNPMIDDGTFFIPTTVEYELERFSDRVERYFKTVPEQFPEAVAALDTLLERASRGESIEPTEGK